MWSHTRQIVELDCVIENCTELIVNGFEIDRGVWLSVFVAGLYQCVLPFYHIPGLDIAHALPFEVREDLSFDDTLLHIPGAELDALLHVFLVEFIERFKRHFQITGALSKEITLPV